MQTMSEKSGLRQRKNKPVTMRTIEEGLPTDSLLTEFKALIADKNWQRLPQSYFTHSTLQDDFHHFHALKELYLKTQEQIRGIDKERLNFSQYPEAKKQELIAELKALYQDALLIKTNIQYYFSNKDFDTLIDRITEQQESLKESLKTLLIIFRKEAEIDPNFPRFAKGIMQDLNRDYAAFSPETLTILSEAFAFKRLFSFSNFGIEFIKPKSHKMLFGFMQEQLHLYQELHLLLQNKINGYYAHRLKDMMEKGIASVWKWKNLFSSQDHNEPFYQQATKDIAILEQYQALRQELVNKEQQILTSFVREYNPAPLDNHLQEEQRAIFHQLEQLEKDFIAHYRQLETRLEQVYSEKYAFILTEADASFLEASSAAETGVLDDEGLLASFSRDQGLGQDNLEDKEPLWKLQPRVRDFIKRLRKYQVAVEKAVMQEALQVLNAHTEELDALLNDAEVIPEPTYTRIFKPLKCYIVVQAENIRKGLIKLPEESNRCWQKRLQKLAHDFQEDLAYYQERKEVLMQRINAKPYQVSLKAMQNIEKEYKRVYQKYATKNQNKLYHSLQELCEQDYHFSQKVLDPIDPRLAQLALLYQQFFSLNRQFIDEDLKKCTDADYNQKLADITQKTARGLTQFSDSIRGEWMQFIRTHILHPIKEVLEEYGFIEKPPTQKFFKAPLACYTEDVVHESIEEVEAELACLPQR